MTRRGDRIRRYVLMSLGWPMVIFGIVTFPVPLIPSTTIAVIGLLLLAQVHPWARAIVVRSRRRWRRLNRAYCHVRAVLHSRRGGATAASAPPAPCSASSLPPCLPAPPPLLEETGPALRQ